MRKWLSVCGAVALADLVWVVYIRSIAAEQHVLAASAAVAIILLSAFVTISYVGDRRMLWPAALGAFVGTLLSSMWL